MMPATDAAKEDTDAQVPPRSVTMHSPIARLNAMQLNPEEEINSDLWRCAKRSELPQTILMLWKSTSRDIWM